ncbi:MAG: LacI family DNA-binding transcriptional regulator [Allobaculum sp.]
MANVTMKEIARISGWSLGTVSRVLSDASGVNEQAREEVLQTARRLNYQKNDIASALRQKKPDGILIVVIGDGSPIYDQLSLRLKERLESSSKRVHLLRVRPDQDEGQLTLEQMRQAMPGAIVFLAARREKLRRLYGRIPIPAVSVGADLENWPDTNLVSLSLPDTEIFQQVTESFFEQDKKHIGVIMNDRFSYTELADRFLGIQYAFYSRDLILDADHMTTIQPSTYEGGYLGLTKLYKNNPELDAVLVGNEEQAVGVLRAARDLNIEVGKDLLVFAMDLSAASRYTIPRLSGIRRNLSEDVEKILKVLEELATKFSNDVTREQELAWSVEWQDSCCRIETIEALKEGRDRL